MTRIGRGFLAGLALAATVAARASADTSWTGNGTYCGGNTFSTCFSVNMSWSNSSGTSTVVTLVMSNQQNAAGLKWFSVGLNNLPAGLGYTSGPSDLGFTAPGHGHSGGMFPPNTYAQGTNGGADPGFNVPRSFTFNFTSGSSKNWNNLLNAAGVGLHAGGLTAPDGTSCSVKVSVNDGDTNGPDGSKPACETLITSTPEPAGMILLATGLVALGGAGLIRRRKT